MSIEIKEVVKEAHMHSDVLSLKFLSSRTVHQLNVTHPTVQPSHGCFFTRDFGKAKLSLWSEDLGWVNVYLEPTSAYQAENMAKIVQTVHKMF